MKNSIQSLKEQLAEALVVASKKLFDIDVEPQIAPADPKFADFQTNLPFTIVKIAKKPPHEISNMLVKEIESSFTESLSINVKGGFINFALTERFLNDMVKLIRNDIESFVSSETEGKREKIQIEFVSANPTGPMNIVSARAAAVGDTLIRLMRQSGIDAFSEYYLNDAGNQVKVLKRSFEARIKEARGEKIDLPQDAYHGEYLADYAKIYVESGSTEDPLEWIMNKLIGENRQVLADFNTTFDNWFSEYAFRKTGAVEKMLERIPADDKYENDGAIWFKASKYNPSITDYVLVRSDGSFGYILVDIAYNADKIENRGFDKAIMIIGPDHHGHVARMEAAMESIGLKGRLELLILQQVNLFEGGDKVMMSKRAGKILTMDLLIDEVGTDVGRYFFLTRKMEAHLDFDLDLARSHSDDNPIFYIQYAHARLSNILEHAKNKGYDLENLNEDDIVFSSPDEQEILHKVARMPGIIEISAQTKQPHLMAFYMLELARIFHPFYFKNRIVSDDAVVTNKRLVLSLALQQIFRKGLQLLGISAPANM